MAEVADRIHGRRLGQLMEMQKATVGFAKGGWKSRGVSETPQDLPTLAEAGIDKNLAKRARKLLRNSLRGFSLARYLHSPMPQTRWANSAAAANGPPARRNDLRRGAFGLCRVASPATPNMRDLGPSHPPWLGPLFDQGWRC
jgi:hypothetical protein